MNKFIQYKDFVYTRDGKKVKNLVFYEDCVTRFKLVGIVEGNLRTWTENGFSLSYDSPSPFDLTINKQIELNIYLDSTTGQYHIFPEDTVNIPTYFEFKTKVYIDETFK